MGPSERRNPSYEDILQFPITYVAGGASQNAARGAAVSEDPTRSSIDR